MQADRNQEMRNALKDISRRLGEGGASRRAAGVILNELKS